MNAAGRPAQHTDAAILAAVELAGGNRTRAGVELHLSPAHIRRVLARNGVPRGRPGQKPGAASPRARRVALPVAPGLVLDNRAGLFQRRRGDCRSLAACEEAWRAAHGCEQARCPVGCAGYGVAS